MDSSRLEGSPQGEVHLDTVRSLHQTVVSLRNALELSKNELQQLKEKYKKHSECINYEDLVEKLTIENHILRRKIIDTGQGDNIFEDINLQVTYSDVKDVLIEDDTADNPNLNVSDHDLETNTLAADVVSEFSDKDTDSYKSHQEIPENISKETNSPSPFKHNYNTESLNINIEDNQRDTSKDGTEVEEIKSEETIKTPELRSHCHFSRSGFRSKLELSSKFDVKIKVTTLKDGAVTSTTTSDSESTIDDSKSQTNLNQPDVIDSKDIVEKNPKVIDNKGTNTTIKSVSEENIKMAVPNDVDAKSKSDNFDVQVKITSEENLVLDESVDRYKRRETLHLDIDDISYRSLSEGDNSVFSASTPADVSGDQSSVLERKQHDQSKDVEATNSDNDSEEVDDIELIFTTDDSKDVSNLQEDLVSIRETEYVTSPTSTSHSTPVLIKFHNLDPDFQSPTAENPNINYQSAMNTKNTSLKQKRVSLPNDKEIRHVMTNVKSLDLPSRGILKSSDSKSDFRRSPNASSKRLHSVDSFTCEYRGLSFDTKSSSYELSSSMDVLQRDESMDSFQNNYNMGHRFSVFAATDISKCGISEDDLVGNLNVRRNTCPNPFQHRAQPQLGVRPYISKYNFRGGRSKRESGAQTDLSALPKWSSDGHLAHATIAPGGIPPPALTVPRLPPPRRPTNQKRQLLSDIDFTSMVPELSRSADPLCAIAMNSGNNNLAGNNRSFKGPSLSVDRSNEWPTPTLYAPHPPPPKYGGRLWRTSLPDVRNDDTDELLEETEVYLRRSIDNLRARPAAQRSLDIANLSRPYIPAEPRHLRLGHVVKVITPHGRVAVGRVRYVGLAGGNANDSTIMVGAIFPTADHQYLPQNDGTYNSRRYFLAPPNHTALFVPFRKVLLAWAN